MPLEQHWERQRRPTTRRERRVLAAVGALLAACAVAAVLYAVLHGSGSGAGCVSVTTPTSTGGALLRRCGTAARAWCREERTRTDPIARQLEEACRRAGLRG